MRASTAQPIASVAPVHAPRLAEHFWSLARAMDGGDSDDATGVIRHVLAIFDAMDTGATGSELTAQTMSFLTLLRQSEERGDLLYASPEQARGERMDERSLVFSVGVLIFEKLTGRHPFGADGNPQRLARIRKAEMASGVAYFQTINGPLRQILLKCMGPFPDERYESMAELRVALEAFVNGEVAQRTQRMLPALPYGEENESRRPERASSKALDVAAKREVGRRPDSVLALGNERGETTETSVARSPWAARVAWMSAGAILSGALAFALTKPSSADEQAQRPAAEIEPTAVHVERALAQPKPAPDVAPEPREPTTVEPAQPADELFDPDIGGRAVLAAALPCFGDERRAQGLGVGVSLRYDREGSSQRVFFGSSGLDRDERDCLSQALVGLRAGGAPTKPVSVSYDLWLHRDTGRVKARLNDQ